MGNLRERFLQNFAGFKNGDGVRDSAVYLDGHVAYVDVVGDAAQGAQPAFVVRGLNNLTNAPTTLFQIFKDGTSTIVAGSSAIGATLSSITIGSSNFNDGTINNTSIFGGLHASTVILNSTITNGTFGNGQINNVFIDTATISNAVITSATIVNPTIIGLSLAGQVITTASVGTSIFTGGSYANPNFTNPLSFGGSLNTPYITNAVITGATLSTVFIGSATLTSPFMSSVRISGGSLGPVNINGPTIVNGTATSLNISSGVSSVNLFTQPKGVTIQNPTSGVNWDIGNVITPGAVVGIHGKMTGSTSVAFNFRKNGTTTFLPANLTVSAGAVYTHAAIGSLQNVTVASGDYLELQVVTVTGSVGTFTGQLDIR